VSVNKLQLLVLPTFSTHGTAVQYLLLNGCIREIDFSIIYSFW